MKFMIHAPNMTQFYNVNIVRRARVPRSARDRLRGAADRWSNRYEIYCRRNIILKQEPVGPAAARIRASAQRPDLFVAATFTH